MQNQYYNQIVEMLMNRSEGMRVGALARSIYNATCDLFDMQAGSRFNQIYNTIQRYLWQQSRRKQSPFKRLRWGTYALRTQFVHQLELVFDEWEDDGPIVRKDSKKKADEPVMLNLFGW